MTRPRADLGFGAALDDLAGFGAVGQGSTVPRPPREDVAEAARAAGFRSREPKLAEPTPESPPAPKTQRRRRTGRNVQFNIKTTPETIAAFCRIADANGWGLGETLERAVALLEAVERKGRGEELK